MSEVGHCSEGLAFPEELELTPRELELSRIIGKKAFEYAATANKYTIYSPFRGDYRITQYYNSISHKGIDWGLPNFTSLYCPFPSGEVTFAGLTSDGYAWNIRIVDATQGLMCVLAHMPATGAFTVKVGDKVTWQTLIGYSDNTGNSTGPHLHMEIRLAPNFMYSSAINFLSEIDAFPTDVTPIPEFEIPDFPSLPEGRTSALITRWVNVRALPTEYSQDLGDIYPGQVVEIFGYEIDVKGNVWFAVKRGKLVGWAAAYYSKQAWLQLVEAG